MTRCIPRMAIVAFALLALAAPAAAQAKADCKTALTSFKVADKDHSDDPCFVLATLIGTMAKPVLPLVDVFLNDELPSGLFAQRDLQPRGAQQPALSGTPAQGHAIPGIQPAGVASGTIAAVGTDAGADAIAAISVNPIVLALGNQASRALAKWSRTTDLTVFVPVTNTEKEAGDADTDAEATDKPKYFGVRLRFNFTGARAGSQVWDEASRLSRQWIDQSKRNVDRVLAVLAAAPNLAGCATALMAGGADAAKPTACGAAFTFDLNRAEAEKLRDELARVRRAADAKYFGIDVRFDHGDPTLGAEENAAGTFMFAGLAAGRRLGDSGEGRGAGLRARLGMRYAKLDTVSAAEYAIEGAGGFEFVRSLDDQEINGAVGLEFRHGNAEPNLTDAFQTNFGAIRGSLIVPMTTANSLSINAAIPLWGGKSPTLSVNFNWALLLAGVR
jgi:hypothetical protein